ncbi:hypothetical protein GCM10022202_03230 [Microbacterium marinilacus]|uniref:HNH endonuclease n=1 Tax=Microbacterium marinilacus TaxID=415209 RepID=A0ABP7B3V6_9MICO
MDCGEADIVVLEFDHLPGKEKLFDIARGVGGSTRSWKAIEAEIAKCEVVCANCHRRRGAARGGFRKHLLVRGDEIASPDLEPQRRVVPHGGGAKGRHNCRCDACRERRRQYTREWRARRREKTADRDRDPESAP